MRLRAVLAVLLFLSSILDAQREPSSSSEQSTFSAEDSSVQHPVAIPEDVMAILREDDGVRQVLESEKLRPEHLPQKWFSAAEIHLSFARTPDLVVVAEPPLAGSNVDTFWVFRATGHGHELMVTAPAHSLELKKTRSYGYRDIELVSMSAVEVQAVLLRFDGKRYKVAKDQSQPIK